MKKRRVVGTIVIAVVAGIVGAGFATPQQASLLGGSVILVGALRVFSDMRKCQQTSPVPLRLRQMVVPLLLTGGLVMIGMNGLLLSTGSSGSKPALWIGVVCLGACLFLNMKILRTHRRLQSAHTKQETS